MGSGRTGIALALIVGVAAALRLPGVEWGFAVEPGAYHQLHPDEAVSCFEMWSRGSAWLADPNNWHERGMQVQCWALAGLVRAVGADDLTLPAFVRVARLYSVLCGLVGILVVAAVARALDRDPATRARAGVYAALLCALAGAHVVTSFWARGQIQNSVAFFTAILLAQRSLGRATAARWLFAAGIATGVAIGLRWSVALVPMLAVAALVSGTPMRSLGASLAGCLVGFAAGTGFVWTPGQIARFVDVQGHAMLAPERRVGMGTMAAAALACTLVGCGLATSALGLGGIVAAASAALRDVAANGLRLRARLATPATLLAVALVVQLALLTTIKSFEARHTDLLSTGLVAVAGVALARLAHGRGMPRWTATAVVAATIAYQAVYAWGVVTRFTDDPRNGIVDRLATVVPRTAPLFTSWYVPTGALARAGFTLTTERWTAAYALVSDQHALRYLGPSGTFLALGMPASCREIYNCWTEEEREFYQGIFTGRGRQVRRFAAAAWTPELALYRGLFGSRWMFTADLVVFALDAEGAASGPTRSSGPASRAPSYPETSVAMPSFPVR